ncbi:MAG: hypothetical protein KDJ65_38545, partial [Anaerolineae bacterium]|nr:hypothetical protein [Anaerolineae bacterium]
ASLVEAKVILAPNLSFASEAGDSGSERLAGAKEGCGGVRSLGRHGKKWRSQVFDRPSAIDGDRCNNFAAPVLQ